MTVTDHPTSEHRHGQYDRNFYLDQVEVSQRSAGDGSCRSSSIRRPRVGRRRRLRRGHVAAGRSRRCGVVDVSGFDGSSGESGLLQIDATRSSRTISRSRSTSVVGSTWP